MGRRTPKSEPPAARPPRVWEYRDARRFLSDLCAYRKAHEPGFSFRKVAQYAGLGSPNYLQQVMAGKRNLKARTARAVAEALDLRGEEIEFFAMLTQFTQAEDEEERATWYRDILAHAVKFGGTGKVDAARLAYFTHWYIPVVHAMASLKGFKPDLHWIAARIVPKIRSFDAKKALDTLTELEIFAKDDQGAFVVREPRLETEPGLRSIWVREYHRAMIRLSEQALDTWDASMRVVSALTVTVPRSHTAELLRRVDGYRKDLFQWLMAEQADMDAVDGEVFQVNFQAYPLTDTKAT